jgi:spore coat protein U-like protein
MSRLLPRTLLTLAVLALALPARAETATATFNVTATLTSKCEITTAPADVAFAYISFQTDPASSTGGGFQVRCTNTLPYSLSLTVTTGTVAGLAYNISVPSGSFTGTGSNISHTVSGTMVAGQPGTCATSATPCTGSNQHTLTVTY